MSPDRWDSYSEAKGEIKIMTSFTWIFTCRNVNGRCIYSYKQIFLVILLFSFKKPSTISFFILVLLRSLIFFFRNWSSLVSDNSFLTLCVTIFCNYSQLVEISNEKQLYLFKIDCHYFRFINIFRTLPNNT